MDNITCVHRTDSCSNQKRFVTSILGRIVPKMASFEKRHPRKLGNLFLKYSKNAPKNKMSKTFPAQANGS